HDAFAQGGKAGHAVARIDEPRHACCDWRPAREVRDQPIFQSEAVLLAPVMLELDLHPRHIDAGRTFALASLAAHAKVERIADGFRREVGSELAGECQTKRVRATAREV